MNFEEILKVKYDIDPAVYLKKAKQFAKKRYGSRINVKFSSKPKKKLSIYDKDRDKWIDFGASAFKDYIIYSMLGSEDNMSRDAVERRRNLYLKRATKITGDWKDHLYSPNMLAITFLWDGDR